MKKIFFYGIAAFLTFSFILVEASSWTSDAAHSRLGFTITHMGINDVNGEFKDFEVKLNTPNGDFTGATVEMTAQTASITTGMEMRDNHLKTADFFDAEKYPTLTFKSITVTKVPKMNKYTVTGNLTMHGVTKSVVLTATHNGTAKNQAGGDVAGFKMTGTIKRSDFGVGQPSPGLSDEVRLNADLEVAKN
ncbi:MAG: YceI family protein [Flavobacteriia bacterium]|jgi:polyisoprenoid-binding protein YceI